MEKNEFTFEVIASRSFHAHRQDKFIAGPFSDIRWQQMQAIAETVGNTIADAMGEDRSGVGYVLGMYENEVEVIPSVRTSVPCHDARDVGLARALVQRLLLLITQPSEVSSQLFDHALDENAQEKVCVNAQEFLSKNGGNRITTPLKVGVAGAIIGQLQGTFTPRPPDVLAADRTHRGQVIVIALHSEKREAAARDIGSRKVVLFRFSDRHRIPLGESLIYGLVIDLQLEETLDASGKKMLTASDVKCSGQEADEASKVFALT